jgi:hypothetical protein
MLGRQEGNEFNNTSYYNRITSNFLHVKTPLSSSEPDRPAAGGLELTSRASFACLNFSP